MLTIRIYSFSYPKKTRSFFCSFLSDSLLCSGPPSPLIRLSSSRRLLNTHSILRSLLASSLHVPSRLDYSSLSLAHDFFCHFLLPPTFLSKTGSQPPFGSVLCGRGEWGERGRRGLYGSLRDGGSGWLRLCVCLLARGSLWLNLEDGVRASPPPCNN